VSLQQLMESKILTGWIKQLGQTNEASRCIHYLFRSKYESIDFSEMYNQNLLKRYEEETKLNLSDSDW